MRAWSLTFVALCALALFSCSTAGTQGAGDRQPLGSVTSQDDADWATLVFDDRYRVTNNVWNAQAYSGSRSQAVLLEDIDGSRAFGWRWDWPSGRYDVVAYPEVIFGDKPWDEPSGIETPFPVAVGSADVRVDFDLSIRASGVYNAAFSVWCVSSLPARRESISHEIMIWTANSGLTPAGKRQGTASIDGADYDVYVRENHGDASGGTSQSWTYVAFKRKESMTQGTIAIDAFIDYLLGKGMISASNYLTSVEFGNEVVKGSGAVDMRRYAVTVTP